MNFRDILNLFTATNNMDYIPAFSTVKGVLDYCDEHVKALNKIQFRGGNDEYIKTIVTRLRQSFDKNEYFIKVEESNNDEFVCNIKHDNDLRKITFFLMLNTEAKYPYDLKEDNKIVHLFTYFSELPKCLLIHILWGLKFDKYFFECIRYAPIWFSSQFIEEGIKSLKHLEAYDGLEKAHQLIESMLYNASRIETRALDNEEKQQLLAKYLDYTNELLRQSYSPDLEKFTGWSTRKRYKFLGYCILHLANMCIYAFDVFEHKLKKKQDDEYKIYEICTEKCPVISNWNCSEDTMEHLKQTTMCLLNSLHFNIMSVTVDIFIYWAEFDITKTLTLQTEVGNKTFHIMERIKANRALTHDITSVLHIVALRPKSIEEELREATIGHILNKLDEDDSGSKSLWLKELISRGELAFGNEECLNSIRDNVKLIDYRSICSILEYLSENKNVRPSDEEDEGDMDIGEIDNEQRETLLSIVQSSLKNFDKSQLEEIIYNEVKFFGLDVNICEGENFNRKSIEFFNKSTEYFDILMFLQLCLENPMQILTKFFGEACKSEQQLKNFSLVTKECQSVFSNYNASLVCDLYTEKVFEKYYPEAVAIIFRSGNVSNLYRSFFYPNIKTFLADEMLDHLLIMMKTLYVIANESEDENCFDISTMPLLVISAQVLEQCRWELMTYETIKNEVLDQTIKLIKVILNKSKPSLNDKLWVKEKVANFGPLTTFYLQPLIAEKPENILEYQRNKCERNLELKNFLVTIIVRCNLDEMLLISEVPEACECLHKVILALLKVKKEFNENAVKNIRHCLIGYVNVLNKNYKKLITSADDENEIDKQSAAYLLSVILRLLNNAEDVIETSLIIEYQNILLKIIDLAKPLNKQDNDELLEMVLENNSTKFDTFKEKLKLVLENESTNKSD